MLRFFLIFVITLLHTIQIIAQDVTSQLLIEYGTNLESNISQYGEKDYYQFSAQSGDVLFLRMRDETLVDSYINLYNPENELIATDWSDGGLAQFKNFKIKDDGIHTIEVFDRNHNDIGKYGLSLHKLNRNDYSKPLTDHISLKDEITSIVGINTYHLEVKKNDVLFIQMRAETVHFECDFFIYDSRGNELYRAENKGRLATVGPITIEEDDQYTIAIMDRGGNDLNSYGFTSLKLNRHESVEQLQCETGKEEDINILAERKVYRLMAPDGLPFVLDMRSENPRMEARMEIFNENGELIASEVKTNQLVNITMKGIGEESNDDDDDDDEISEIKKLNLTAECLAGSANELIWRVTNPNEFNVNVRWQVYGTSQKGSYDAVPGKSYFRTNYIEGNSNTTKIFWYDENGKEISKTKAHNNQECEEGAIFEDDFDGNLKSYLVVISDRNGNDFGRFGVKSQILNKNACHLSLDCNRSEDMVHIPTLGFNKVYTLDGKEGELFQLELKETASYLEPHIRVYDNTGHMLAESKHSKFAEIRDVPFPYTGTYYALVSDMSGNDIGDFEIKATVEELVFDMPQCLTSYYGVESLCGIQLETGLASQDYEFLWSTGETSSKIEVCPSISQTYSVQVFHSSGCSVTKEIYVDVIDVRCGTEQNSKIQVCHVKNDGRLDDKCIDENGVWEHLENGDGHENCYLGPCEQITVCNPLLTMNKKASNRSIEILQETGPKVFPNPVNDVLNIELGEAKADFVEFKLNNIHGQKVFVIKRPFDNNIQISVQSLDIPNGIYILEFNINELKYKYPVLVID